MPSKFRCIHCGDEAYSEWLCCTKKECITKELESAKKLHDAKTQEEKDAIIIEGRKKIKTINPDWEMDYWDKDNLGND